MPVGRVTSRVERVSVADALPIPRPEPEAAEIAFLRWLDGKVGRECRDALTLRCPYSSAQALVERLRRAFVAGRVSSRVL